MRKIVSFIVLVLFTHTAILSNYSYSNKLNKEYDKLALMRNVCTDNMFDILMHDLPDIIQKYSGKRGEDLVEELEKYYYFIKESTDLIEYIEIEPQRKEDVIDLVIKVKRKRRREADIQAITVYEPIWDESYEELKARADGLSGDYERICIQVIKDELVNYYDGAYLDYITKETFIYLLKKIAPRIKALSKKRYLKEDDENLLYEYLEVVGLIIRNLENNNCRKEKFGKHAREIIDSLNSIKKKNIDEHLKREVIFSLLFLYDKIWLEDRDIKILRYIKDQLNTEKQYYKIINLTKIAAIVAKQENKGKDRLRLIREIINIVSPQLKKKANTGFLKRNIINNLIFVYDNIPDKNITKKDINNLGSMKTKVLKEVNKFSEEKKAKNLAWIAAIIIKKGKYSNGKSVVKNIIKELKTTRRKGYTIELQRKRLAHLGSIAQYLISKEHDTDADNLIIKFFKGVIEDKKCDIAVRTKAIGQLYGVAKKFIQESRKEKAEEIVEYLKGIIENTQDPRIIRKCVAELGAILLRYEESFPKASFCNDLEKFLKPFKDINKYEEMICDTATILLDEFTNLRNKRRKRRIVPNIEEKHIRKLVNKEEVRAKAKKSKRIKVYRKKKRRRIKRKEKALRELVSPEILKISKKLLPKDVWKRINNKKNKGYDKDIYMRNILPRIEDIYKWNNTGRLGNPIEKFAKPITKLRKELMHIGINKDIGYIFRIFEIAKGETDIFSNFIEAYNNISIKKLQASRVVSYFTFNRIEIKDYEDMLERCYKSQTDTNFNWRDDGESLYSVVFRNVMLEKLEDDKRKLIALGQTDTEDYKILVNLIKKLKIIDFEIYYWDVKSGLAQLKGLGIIEIHNNDNRIVSKVHEWPELSYMDLKSRSEKDKVCRFPGNLFLLRDYTDSIDTSLMDKNESTAIWERWGSIESWPEKREEIKKIADEIKSLREYYSGLEDLSDFMLMDMWGGELYNLYSKAPKKIHEYVMVCKEGEDVGKKIKANLTREGGYVGDPRNPDLFDSDIHDHLRRRLRHWIDSFVGVEDEERKKKWKERISREIKAEALEYYQNKVETEDLTRFNSSKSVLLFLAVEDKDNELIKKLCKDNAHLDVWTTDKNNLFKMALKIALGGDRSIFEILMDELNKRPLWDEELKDNIEKYMNFPALYKMELDSFKQKGIYIDPIKDFHKLKLLRKTNEIINTYKNINENIKFLLQDITLNIYNNPDTFFPEEHSLKALIQAA